MEGLLALLPALACPLIMGLMMVWMMRGRPNQARDVMSVEEMPALQPVATAQATETQHAEPGAPTARPVWNAFGLCLNWRVVAALGMIGLAIWIVAPGLLWAAVPVLVLAACPLSMLLMMRGMQGTQCAAQPVQTTPGTAVPLAREEQLSDLRGRLASMQAEGDALAREITALEREHAIERPVEAAARGANGRGAS